MTREDIDNIIRIICPNDEDFEKPIISPAYLKKELETLALEQEPCEKDWRFYYDHGYAQAKRDLCCEDAISRQAVIDGIEKLKKSPWATDKRGNGFEYLITEALDVVADLCVKQAPSVKQEPKTGHWIPTYGNVKCSVCGSVKESRRVGKATHYCDFCGAKMVEPQESEVQE